jgi:hypothetical protein
VNPYEPSRMPLETAVVLHECGFLPYKRCCVASIPRKGGGRFRDWRGVVLATEMRHDWRHCDMLWREL